MRHAHRGVILIVLPNRRGEYMGFSRGSFGPIFFTVYLLFLQVQEIHVIRYFYDPESDDQGKHIYNRIYLFSVGINGKKGFEMGYPTAGFELRVVSVVYEDTPALFRRGLLYSWECMEASPRVH